MAKGRARETRLLLVGQNEHVDEVEAHADEGLVHELGADVHATFYLSSLTDASQRVRDICTWVGHEQSDAR